MTIEDLMDTTINVPANMPNPVQIKVLGVGGGGCNAVNYMYKQGDEDISYAVANTDRQALKSSQVKSQVLLGPKTCGGNGAGANADLARQAAEESEAEINALFNDDTKVVFITAGMGGGTGTGAAPVVARIAKERGILTIGIVTIPFIFEGLPKIRSALRGAEEMRKNVDVLLLVNNQRLVEIYPDLDFVTGFHKADETLCNAAKSISDLINKTGYVNCDLKDVCTILRDQGSAIISTGVGSGEYRITEALNNCLNSPLLKNKNIYTARQILVCIHHNEKAQRPFKMEETNQLAAFTESFENQVTFIWGHYIDPELGENIKMTVLVAGFDVDGDAEYETVVGSRKVNKQHPQPLSSKQREEGAAEDELDSKIKKIYGGTTTQRFRLDAQRVIVLSPEQYDDEDVIELLEQNPTYSRDVAVVEKLRKEGKSTGGNVVAF